MEPVCVYKDPTMYGVHGITAAFHQQKKALRRNGVEVKEKPKEPYGIIHINWPGPVSFLRLKQARREGKLGVVFAHSGEDIEGGFTLSRYLKNPFLKWLSSLYNSGDVIVAPSEYTKRVTAGMGVESEKVRVISNGVDFSKLQNTEGGRKKYRKRFGLDQPTVISVGQVIPRKDVTTFVSVARNLSQYQFVWYGHRMNRLFMFDRKMENAINNRPDNTQFTGYVEDIGAAFSSGDVFFFPSKEENEGIVILEAAARGLPIVTRDLPAYEGWLEDEVNCLKGDSLEEFVDLITKLMEEPELRKRLTTKAKEMASKHRLENIGKKYLDLYKEYNIGDGT